MNDLALAIGALVAVLTVVTVAAAAGGGVGGAAAGCAIGAVFFGIGCLIGGIIGAIIGALAAGGAAAAVSYLIVKGTLNAVFDANPGNVEDANVGDKRLGPIRENDKVAVLGEHVYDGFHEGWHELHPLMAVVDSETKPPTTLNGIPGSDGARFQQISPGCPPPQPTTSPTSPPWTCNKGSTATSSADEQSGFENAGAPGSTKRSTPPCTQPNRA